MRPKRIILIRHGESEGNSDPSIYEKKPDYALELSERGLEQAKEAGKKLKDLIKEESAFLYVRLFGGHGGHMSRLPSPLIQVN
jgi:broad specificity phosphatase PhoE